jgi:hypothetical protein
MVKEMVSVNKKKNYRILFVVALLLMTTVYFVGCNVKDRTDMTKYSNYKFIASKSSKIFHTRTCFLGKRIALDDAAFFNSRDEAIDAGYKPDTFACHP